MKVYQAQKESIVLPLRCGTPMHAVSAVFLHKAVHKKGESIERTSGRFYYLAARKLLRPLLNSQTVKAVKKIYEQAAPVYAELLAGSLDAFDAVAAIPTSKPAILAPYESAVVKRRNGVQILTPYLHRSVSSTDDVSFEERLEATTFSPPDGIATPKHVVLVDDVLDTGISAAAAIKGFTRYWPDGRFQFTLLCPLWIVHRD